jgi:hypothetical protein
MDKPPNSRKDGFKEEIKRLREIYNKQGDTTNLLSPGPGKFFHDISLCRKPDGVTYHTY